MLKVINFNGERKEKKREAEIKKAKLDYRARQLYSLIALVATVLVYMIARSEAVITRGTENLYGGEVLILVMGISVAFMIYPKYSLARLIREPEEFSRHYSNHVDIDIYSKDLLIDSVNEGYMFDVDSENGIYDIIDHSQRHHIIALSRRK